VQGRKKARVLLFERQKVKNFKVLPLQGQNFNF
jgi:hypothetical protein